MEDCGEVEMAQTVMSWLDDDEVILRLPDGLLDIAFFRRGLLHQRLPDMERAWALVLEVVSREPWWAIACPERVWQAVQATLRTTSTPLRAISGIRGEIWVASVVDAAVLPLICPGEMTRGNEVLFIAAVSHDDDAAMAMLEMTPLYTGDRLKVLLYGDGNEVRVEMPSDLLGELLADMGLPAE